MMQGDFTIWVRCTQNGKEIATYDFLSPQNLAGNASPDINNAIEQAKGNLAMERLAFPPFTGIGFETAVTEAGRRGTNWKRW